MSNCDILYCIWDYVVIYQIKFFGLSTFIGQEFSSYLAKELIDIGNGL